MKEKAIELVNKFRETIENSTHLIGHIDLEIAAKYSALLHCDLMIEELAAFDSEEVKLGIEYYMELKEEIEKL